jgi:hypothetical protein
LRPGTVQLAALLVRLEGEMVVSGVTSAEPFIECAYARDRAHLLAERHRAGQRVWTRPATPLPKLEPEPDPEPEPLTLYDLVRTWQSIMRDAERWRTRRQGRSKPVVPPSPVATILVQSHELWSSRSN